MYLSKLELFGFKSFANKTKLKFNDGIACVIGPNGSGKSNIVDSIRWVLGEQKVTTLRSDKMESVIFNGTNTRKPLGLAEVSLTIQNTKKILDSPFSEVVISRRLYRNGESQYLINKTPCRLKDILNLFMDTGMNSNSYSVIELKMVESIISENPDERRILFEEAAGVTKYKIRRKAAFRKLAATKADMSRISDMISEITRNVNSLSRQVGKARRYLKYQEELKHKDVELAKFNFYRYEDDIQPLEKQLKEVSVIKEDTSHQITLEETLLEDYKQEIIQFEQKLSNYNKQIYEFDKQIQNIKEEEAVSKTRISALHETIKRNSNDILEFNEKQETLQNQRQEITNNKNKIATEIEHVQAEYNQKTAEFEKLTNDYDTKQKEIEKLENEFNALSEKLNSVIENNKNNKYKLNWNEEQIQNLETELSQILKNNEQSKSEFEALNDQKNKTDQLISEKSLENESLKAKNNSLITEIENINAKLISLNSREEVLESKIQFFKNIIENYEGFSDSTKYFMQNKSQFPGLLGPLSDFISIDSKYSVAVESALGAAINYLIADDTKTAIKLIEECKKQNLGKISVMPLDRIKNINVTPPAQTNYKLLSTIIKSKNNLSKIFDILLSDIAVVDSLKEALNATDQGSKLKFVTINGETVNFNLGISGGQKQNEDEIMIGRENVLQQYFDQIKQIKKEKSDLNNFLSTKQDKKDKLLDQINSINLSLEDLKDQLININQKLSQVSYVKENSINVKQKIESEIQSIRLKNQEILSEIAEQDKTLIKLKDNCKESEKIIQEKNSIAIDAKKAIDAMNENVQNIKLELVNRQNQLNIYENDLTRINESLEEIKNLLIKRNEDNSQIAIDIENLEQTKDKNDLLKDEIYQKRDNLESEKEQYEVKYHEIRDNILNLESQIKKYRKQHDSTLERTKQLELQIQENKMKSEMIKDRIKEDYNIDITTSLPYEGINVDEYEQDIESLKSKIKMLGQVNPLAVNEYESESERLEFYTKQYNDLEQAIDSLQKTIDKINHTARKQFKDTFELIKKNFEKVFCNFFQNGEGTLALEEGVDPLEADIDIMVRPKGKRIQTLNLLSGGEKTLTAISLLFAIYLVKPSPFCILDEIDAPLDDINIRRFTDALKKFAIDTQFIVITHNKRTMEAADTLYGVTMEEEGLSKLVSVKFN